LSPRVQRLALVGWVGDLSFLRGRTAVERRQGLATLADPVDETRLREGHELVPAVEPWAVQLLGHKRQRIL
jgi:hypothetical protein